jgi:hypothetical protein
VPSIASETPPLVTTPASTTRAARGVACRRERFQGGQRRGGFGAHRRGVGWRRGRRAGRRQSAGADRGDTKRIEPPSLQIGEPVPYLAPEVVHDAQVAWNALARLELLLGLPPAPVPDHGRIDVI